MSKSYGNAINLSDTEAVVRQKLKTMITDPARVRALTPEIRRGRPVYDFHKTFSPLPVIEQVNQDCPERRNPAASIARSWWPIAWWNASHRCGGSRELTQHPGAWMTPKGTGAAADRCLLRRWPKCLAMKIPMPIHLGKFWKSKLDRSALINRTPHPEEDRCVTA